MIGIGMAKSKKASLHFAMLFHTSLFMFYLLDSLAKGFERPGDVGIGSIRLKLQGNRSWSFEEGEFDVIR